MALSKPAVLKVYQFLGWPPKYQKPWKSGITHIKRHILQTPSIIGTVSKNSESLYIDLPKRRNQTIIWDLLKKVKEIDRHLGVLSNRHRQADALNPLIWKIGLNRATIVQKVKSEVSRGGHIGVTTFQGAPYVLYRLHQRKWKRTFYVCRFSAYNCQILNENIPRRDNIL